MSMPLPPAPEDEATTSTARPSRVWPLVLVGFLVAVVASVIGFQIFQRGPSVVECKDQMSAALEQGGEPDSRAALIGACKGLPDEDVRKIVGEIMSDQIKKGAVDLTP